MRLGEVLIVLVEVVVAGPWRVRRVQVQVWGQGRDVPTLSPPPLPHFFFWHFYSLHSFFFFLICDLHFICTCNTEMSSGDVKW